MNAATPDKRNRLAEFLLYHTHERPKERSEQQKLFVGMVRRIDLALNNMLNARGCHTHISGTGGRYSCAGPFADPRNLACGQSCAALARLNPAEPKPCRFLAVICAAFALSVRRCGTLWQGSGRGAGLCAGIANRPTGPRVLSHLGQSDEVPRLDRGSSGTRRQSG